jgi:hypothetical protein
MALRSFPSERRVEKQGELLEVPKTRDNQQPIPDFYQGRFRDYPKREYSEKIFGGSPLHLNSNEHGDDIVHTRSNARQYVSYWS